MRPDPASLAPLLLLVAALAFWAYCLRDFMLTDEREMRQFTEPVWSVLLVLGSVLGGVLWFSFGRPQPPKGR